MSICVLSRFILFLLARRLIRYQYSLWRTRTGVTLSLKVGIINCFDRGGLNKEIARALNLPVSIILSVYKPCILKAAKVSIGSASNNVVSFSWHPVMDKMGYLLSLSFSLVLFRD